VLRLVYLIHDLDTDDRPCPGSISFTLSETYYSGGLHSGLLSDGHMMEVCPTDRAITGIVLPTPVYVLLKIHDVGLILSQAMTPLIFPSQLFYVLWRRRETV
jgi:hypothetical protein